MLLFCLLKAKEQLGSFRTSKNQILQQYRCYLLITYYMPASVLYIHPHLSYRFMFLFTLYRYTHKFEDKEQRH